MPVPPGADNRIVATGQGAAPGRHQAFLAVAALTGLLLGSEPLLGWTEKLPDWPGLVPVRQGATSWHAAMLAVGLTLPYTAVREAARGLEAARF